MSAPLSDAQGYQLVRVGKKWQLPVDLQKLIWADVTGRYHRRHGRWGSFGLPVIEKAHLVLDLPGPLIVQGPVTYHLCDRG